ncbi:VWA domain-containing protein, partial [bacterium]|nr:VWA domain-containing protein [bacterium]
MIQYWIRISILAAFVSTAILLAGPVQAETELMILVDASGEMAAMGEPGTTHTKFDEMKNAITALLQALPDDTAVGLRAMGSSPAADCYNTYL